jgi:hypothetical protein
MNELVREIARELDITEEKAILAVQITSGYLCRKLPDFMNEDVDAVLLTPETDQEKTREVGLFPMP